MPSGHLPTSVLPESDTNPSTARVTLRHFVISLRMAARREGTPAGTAASLMTAARTLPWCDPQHAACSHVHVSDRASIESAISDHLTNGDHSPDVQTQLNKALSLLSACRA